MATGRAERSAGAPPPGVQARLVAALGHHQRGDLPTAETAYREVLAAAPACFDALHLLGVLLTQRGALDEGIVLLRQAIAQDRSQPIARLSLARALLEQGDADGALATCEELVASQPANAQAWFLRGNAWQLGGAHDRAVESYERALRIQPEFSAALNNLGHSLRVQRRTDHALAVFAQALALQPHYAIAFNNRGLALLDLGRLAEAVQSFDQALACAPHFPEALSNRGTTLLQGRRYAEAGDTFARLVALAPGFGGAWGNLLYARRNCCDWRDYQPLCDRVLAAIRRREFAATPLSFLCVTDSAEAQLLCAQTFTAARYPPASPGAAPCRALRRERIRVAYLSGDFGEHAISHLLAGVIEQHDDHRFETIAIAWGRQNDGPMRTRLEAAFERFVDATALSDREVAALLRQHEVDIAVDLTGHTGGQRTGIFAQRSAALQVSYLGYPGTSGAGYMDYIIADSIVVPAGDEDAYTERIARLPHCFLPSDDGRIVASECGSRAQAGLPVAGFVFCAFNNPLKITPEVFAIWMSLLRELPESVLWLRAGAPEVAPNLVRAAERHGVDPARLVFASPVESPALHLARHRLADLFLDTLPYNAHATASDALWAGLPVLTCRGRSFASRVGASLLCALDLPELVTDSLESYRSVALALARDPGCLAGLRQRLGRARRSSACFDTALYCRHLEALYTTMWQRQCDGLAPSSFTVPLNSIPSETALRPPQPPAAATCA